MKLYLIKDSPKQQSQRTVSINYKKGLIQTYHYKTYNSEGLCSFFTHMCASVRALARTQNHNHTEKLNVLVKKQGQNKIKENKLQHMLYFQYKTNTEKILKS